MSKNIQKIFVDVELRPILFRMQQYQKECREQGILYAICASVKGFGVKEKDCEIEFQKYMSCLRSSQV